MGGNIIILILGSPPHGGHKPRWALGWCAPRDRGGAAAYFACGVWCTWWWFPTCRGAGAGLVSARSCSGLSQELARRRRARCSPTRGHQAAVAAPSPRAGPPPMLWRKHALELRPRGTEAVRGWAGRSSQNHRKARKACCAPLWGSPGYERAFAARRITYGACQALRWLGPAGPARRQRSARTHHCPCRARRGEFPSPRPPLAPLLRLPRKVASQAPPPLPVPAPACTAGPGRSWQRILGGARCGGGSLYPRWAWRARVFVANEEVRRLETGGRGRRGPVLTPANTVPLPCPPACQLQRWATIGQRRHYAAAPGSLALRQVRQCCRSLRQHASVQDTAQ